MCAVSAQPAPELPGILRREQNSSNTQRKCGAAKDLCVCFSFKSMCTNLQKFANSFSERQSRTSGPPILC